MILKVASKKLGILFRLRDFISLSQLLQLYLCIQYCYHLWGGSDCTIPLYSIKSNSKSIIKLTTLLSGSLDLSLRRYNSALFLFFHRHSSILLLCRPHSTRSALLSHEFCVTILNSVLSCCSASYQPFLFCGTSYPHPFILQYFFSFRSTFAPY